MKKISLILIISLIVGFTAIFFLPFPVYKNVTLSGIHSVNGEISETITVSLKGWYLNYLFRTDKLTGKLVLENNTNDSIEITLNSDIWKLNQQYLMSFLYYEPKRNGYVGGNLYVSGNFDSLLLTTTALSEDEYYAASNDLNSDWNYLIDRLLAGKE